MSLHWGGKGPGHLSRWPKAAVIFEAETVSLIARMTTPPSATRAALINAAILSLKSAGLWAKLEILYFPAAADSQAALLNWISTSFNATAVNSPTFTADRGFAGNGSSSYLNTNWNPSLSSIYTANSASMGVWINAGTTTGSNSRSAMGVYSTSGIGSYITPRSATDTILAAVNQVSASSVGSSVTNPYGLTAATKSASASLAVYKNGASVATPSTSDALRVNGNALIGALTRTDTSTVTNYSDYRVACAFAASAFDATDQANFYNIVNTYLTAVGGA